MDKAKKRIYCIQFSENWGWNNIEHEHNAKYDIIPGHEERCRVAREFIEKYKTFENE